MSEDANLPAVPRPLPAAQRAALLWTKLRIPPTRAGYVPRLRLMRLLEEGVQRKLALVSAPAGFGKTTCLSSWATNPDHTARPVAWVTLDTSDNDPVRFWSYLVAAVDSLLPGVEQAVAPWLVAVQAGSIEVFLTAFVNSLTAITHDAFLVLDDYHAIDTELIHDGLARLIELMPPQMHLVIASRVDPPLPLARLRARHQLLSIRAADLCFTPEEAGAFLHRTMGLDLPSEVIAVLDARTEGWIVGLQLAALSIQDSEHVQAFVAAFSGSHRYVLDYLLEEVLQHQPAWLQTFLLQTSILDRMCPSLCAAVSRIQVADIHMDRYGPGNLPGRFAPSATETVLDYLERANLFVIPLDDERHWYRYHHLFADLLRHYLRLRYPDLIVELHRRASAWYADNQLLDEAVEHALAARLYPRAAHLIEQAGWPMLEQRGEISTLLRWLQRVPDAEIRARPRLCVMYAWLLLLSGQVQVVEQWLSPVGVGPAVPDMEGDDAAFMQGYSTAARAYLAIMQNDLPGAEEHASQALARLPANNQTLRGLLQLFQGGIYRLSGHVRAATEALREASALCEAAGNRLVAVAALSNLAEVQIIQGRLHQAHQIFEQAARLASVQPGRASPLLGRVYIGLGDLLRQWNDLAAATSYLQQSMPLLEAMAATEELVLAYVYLARVKQAHGEPEAACLLIDQAEQLAQNYHLSDVLRWTRINRTCLWLAQGRMAGVMQWIEEQQHASNSIPFPVSSLLDEFDALTRARVLIARGHDDGAALQEALALLNQLHHAALEAGRSGTLIGILVLQSLALEARGERQAALAALERALRLAEPEGYVRIFVDEGAPMAGLLFAYGRSQPEGTSRRRYLEQLLRAFGEGSTQRHPPSIARSASSEAGLGEDLSERELEILRLLAAGRSNQEIGRALLIAEGTVKKHTHNIFGKLEVRGRTQAVLRAGELGLV